MKEKFPIFGVILAAFTASLCCLGPALLAGIGIGTLAGGSFFAKYHLLFYGLGGILLALSLFYYIRRKQSSCACETESTINQKNQSSTRYKFPLVESFLLLGAFAIAVYGLMKWATPSLYSLHSIKSSHVNSTVLSSQTLSESTQIPVKTVLVRFTVHKMDCPMCVYGIRHTILSLKGVYAAKVSYNQKKALICFDPKQTTMAQIQTVISKIGYRADSGKKFSCQKPGSLQVAYK